MPECFAESPDGLLYTANGIDPVLRWDGVSSEFVLAGVDPPTVAPVLSSAGTGSLKGTYYAYLRFVDDRGNVSNLSPLSAPITINNVEKILYNNLEIPTDSKVTKRQLLRNTAGQTRVFYVDVESSDLMATSLESTNTDSLLQVQPAVPLIDEKGNVLANLNEPPPSDRAFLAVHLSRMFLAGEEVYQQGMVGVTFGSKEVSGYATEWPPTLAGRFLYVSKSERPYEIESVDSSTQKIVLAEVYEEETQAYASYAIRPSVASKKLVYYSEASKPESWSSFSAISIQEDGDSITGLMPKGSFLYILEKRHAYRLTYQKSPEEDGLVFLALNRGCINNRCWVKVGDMAFLLDEAGVYAFDGGQEIEELSLPIQSLFESGRSPTMQYRIFWESARWFHAAYDPGQRIIRWFVSLSGPGYPRHALCLDLQAVRWWVEAYPVPIVASITGSYQGQRRVFLGGPYGKVFLLGGSRLDGMHDNYPSVRGKVTKASYRWLQDKQQTFPTIMVRSTVSIVAGKGTYQTRHIVKADGDKLWIDRPWTILPDSTSVYQIGGIPWKYRPGWFWLAPGHKEMQRRLEIVFQPLNVDTTLSAQLYVDRSLNPITWEYTRTQVTADGFSSEKGSSELIADLTKPSGFVQKRLDGQKDLYIDGHRVITWDFSGVSNQEQVCLYQITLDGVLNPTWIVVDRE